MKNKMVFEGYEEVWIVLIPILLFIGAVIVMAVEVHYENNAKDTACKVGGFKGMSTYLTESICLDHNGDVHFVRFDCKGSFRKVRCKATLIRVGEVWGSLE